MYISTDLEFNSKQNTEITEEIEVIEISPKKTLEMVLKEEIWSSATVASILRAAIVYPELFK